MSSLHIVQADLRDPQHQVAVLEMTRAYACDPMGEEFLNAWGEPYRKQLSRWNLWPGNWPFVPQYLWWWRLADEHVQCRIDHPIYTGFKKTVCRRCVTVDLFPEEAARNPG